MNEQTSSIPSLTLESNAPAAAQAAVEEAPAVKDSSAPAAVEIKTEKPNLSAQRSRQPCWIFPRR